MTGTFNLGDNYTIKENSNGNLEVTDSTGSTVLRQQDGNDGIEVVMPFDAIDADAGKLLTALDANNNDINNIAALKAQSATVDDPPSANDDVVRKQELDALDLEDVRAVDNAVAGDVDMSGQQLLNLAAITASGSAVSVDSPIDGQDPTAASELTTKSYVDGVAQGLEYKESVIDEQDTPPSSPASGDRYRIEPATFAIVAVDTSNEIVTISGDQSARFDAGESFEIIGSTGNDGDYSIASVTYDSTNDETDLTVNEDITDSTADGDVVHADGAWNGHNEELTEYDGSSWTFETPNEGWSVFVEDVDVLKTYNGTDWVQFGSTLDHGALQGLGDDDHTQYLLVDGSRSATGDIDAPGYTVDGNRLAQSVVASGQKQLSSGSATVDTGLSATDATFQLALGVDDPDADTKVSGRLFWDDSAGTYKIEIVESGTGVGNPTVNYDIVRVR